MEIVCSKTSVTDTLVKNVQMNISISTCSDKEVEILEYSIIVSLFPH